MILTPSKFFFEPYMFALYHQEIKNFQNIEDNQPSTPSHFHCDKTRTHNFQPSFLF